MTRPTIYSYKTNSLLSDGLEELILNSLLWPLELESSQDFKKSPQKNLVKPEPLENSNSELPMKKCLSLKIALFSKLSLFLLEEEVKWLWMKPSDHYMILFVLLETWSKTQESYMEVEPLNLPAPSLFNKKPIKSHPLNNTPWEPSVTLWNSSPQSWLKTPDLILLIALPKPNLDKSLKIIIDLELIA